MKFPTELLYILFDLADPRPAYRTWKKYLTHIEAENDDGTHNSPEREPPPPPTQYPHHLARVCRRWNDVLAGTPQRWNNPIVFLDHDIDETLADLKMSLRLSQDVPLEVVVDYTRKIEKRGDSLSWPRWGSDISPYRDEEPWRSRAVIEALRPHFPRCRNITFEARFGMSLPSPSKDLSSVSPMLQNLILKCKYDFQHQSDLLFGGDPAPIPDTNQANFKLTDLSGLTLSGYTVIDACRNFPELIHAAQDSLTLRNFRTRDSKAADTVPYLLQALSLSCADIVVHDIDLPLWQPDAPPREPFQLQGCTTLSALGDETMRNILDFVDFYDAGILIIKRCALPPGASRFRPVDSLLLIKLSNFPDLADMLSEWDGWHLSITHGPPLNGLLRMLARRRRMGDLSMDELELNCCTRFSADAMKELCESRTPDNLGEYSRMDSISVNDIGPVIRTDDRRWFEERYPDMISWADEMMDSEGNSYYADRDDMTDVVSGYSDDEE
ncbi:unnamed protein product [Cyclocybe aegerita]|uniref:F-box domain-containing protein n=1 Tax=Cyclocybe aegerita TaxID=1973307 RepID=A0A8S0VZT8_CYCAE|nr:unnamed protein product [Cyclocybe aegerita]